MNFESTEDMTRGEHFNVLIYSKPGGGKTSTTKYLKGSTVLLDIDGTRKVLSGEKGIKATPIDKNNPEKSMGTFYKYVLDNIDDIDNVVLDNLTHYQKLWFIHRGSMTKSGMPEIKDYGLFENHLIKFIDTMNSLPVNVVYTAWETTHEIQTEEGQLYHQFLPDLRPKVVSHVMGIVSVVARLITSTKDKNRYFILRESNGTFAKNQLDDREYTAQAELFNFGSEEVTEDSGVADDE